MVMEQEPIRAWEATSARLDPEDERRFWEGVEGAARFFMGDSNVQRALERLVSTLEAQKIPYAIVGAMALNEFGYRRVTVDVDVLLTPAGLTALKAASLGHGYVEKFPGSCGLRDTENGVDIDVVLTGGYPGDGKPKPVSFPDPAKVAVRGSRVALLPLPKLIELASGMSAPHRLKDLADVIELIRAASLPSIWRTRSIRLSATSTWSSGPPPRPPIRNKDPRPGTLVYRLRVGGAHALFEEVRDPVAIPLAVEVLAGEGEGRRSSVLTLDRIAGLLDRSP
jgi:hypothetical protein